LSLKLAGEGNDKIKDTYPVDIGFPLDFLFTGQHTPSRKCEDVWLTIAIRIDNRGKTVANGSTIFEDWKC
jgi:hypothetical protein